jgi:TolB-like protein/DNA-binding winged helix-turn-helix (wHTH) protein
MPGDERTIGVTRAMDNRGRPADNREVQADVRLQVTRLAGFCRLHPRKNTVQSPRIIRFGSFEADLHTRELRKHGLRVKVQEQPFQVLAMLLARPGELVTREEIRSRLWPQDTFIDFDHGLNAAVRRLRDALNDHAETPRFVETLPRRGYRFIASVEKPTIEEPVQQKAGVTNSAVATTPSTETGAGLAEKLALQKVVDVGHEVDPTPMSIAAKPAAVVDSETPPAVMPVPVRPSASFPQQPPVLQRTEQARAPKRAKVLLAAILMLAVVAAVFVPYQIARKKTKRPAIRSLAVLPLQNLSGDPAQQYLADGITEELIGRLSAIRDLRVISRTSVMRFKNTQLLIPEIARTLGVDAIVEGSVMRDGDRIRVHAQLIHDLLHRVGLDRPS